MNITEKARVFATAAHSAIGQKRKYTDEPYIVHPEMVAFMVKSVPHTNEMIAAAWLHDVVEDTQVTIRDICHEFGVNVAELVMQLTDISVPSDGNRLVRKEIDREHIAQASPSAKTIKLADLIDNTHNIINHDKDFAKVYLKEKKLLLDVLIEGDPALMKMAKEIVSKSTAQLYGLTT